MRPPKDSIVSALVIAGLVTGLATSRLAAQAGSGHQHVHRSPYADQEETGIAALSRQELEQLESGEGMGLARAGELNRFPGPKHVLELGAALQLSREQEEKIRNVFDRMLGDAVRIGSEIIENERRLDLRFRHRHADEDSVRDLTAGIAELRGELRFVHLRAHLATTAMLSAEQIGEYNRLRGYDPPE